MEFLEGLELFNMTTETTLKANLLMEGVKAEEGT